MEWKLLYFIWLRNIALLPAISRNPEISIFCRRQKTVVKDYFINQIHQQKRIVFVIFNNDYFQFIKLQNPKEPPFQLCHYHSEYMRINTANKLI